MNYEIGIIEDLLNTLAGRKDVPMHLKWDISSSVVLACLIAIAIVGGIVIGNKLIRK